MPGMSQRSIDLTNPVIVSLFRHTSLVTMLLWIALVALAIIVVTAATGRITRFNLSVAGIAEPRARRNLRVGFGLLWLIDGILQFQSSMPLGLANAVVAPMSRSAPSTLRTLIEQFINLWNAHPITLASGVAWLEIGLGLLMLVSNGTIGRVAGATSVAWATLIWLVGESAGGLFVHGATILFGWPGSAMIYGVAGTWIALDVERFRRWFQVVTQRSVAVLLLAGAVEQSLPVAGFWRGGPANALARMTSYMSAIDQPRWLASTVRSVGSVAATMGGGFNVVILLWLVVTALGLWVSAASTRRWAIYSVLVGTVVLWVVAQDTALFGGLSTDVNTMPPLAILVWCAAPSRRGASVAQRVLWREVLRSAGSAVAAFSAAMVLVAGVAMGTAVATGAETTLFIAQNGPPTAVNSPARPFTLTDQFAHPYTLGEHHGRVTLLTFLDPNCSTDCAPFASQIAQVRRAFTTNAALDIVAVAANPFHESLRDVRRFVDTQGLGRVSNFFFVTGPRAEVSSVWRDYGISVVMGPSDAMSVHSNVMFIITANGALRWIIPDNPLFSSPGIASAVSELRHLLATAGVR